MFTIRVEKPSSVANLFVIPMEEQPGFRIKIIIVWLAILLMGSFWLTVRMGLEPVSLAVVPQVPREGEPVLATFKLNNPSPQVVETDYQFYANGELLKAGTTLISPNSHKLYVYAYKNPLEIGEQVNFVVRTIFPQGSYEKVVSLPSYPPQIWSSFISIASLATSMMSSMTYYQNNFGNSTGFNVGLLSIMALVGLLIFLELTQPLLRKKTITILGRLRIRFSVVTWILFIIFMGATYTKIVMVLTI